MPVIRNPKLTIAQATAVVALIDDALELELGENDDQTEYLRNAQAKLHVALAEAKRGV